ncbi:hypothetical protein SODALDRAFT_326771 [Sodiomyces alkalinus F11]|uniref:Thioesterase n=1 Tax=Sodiomyces alkalinus (strain CBS 110278 / VKM F-3762 / F11) TaxID=1314773 RepID=A0A3N2Q793_SODAK|nr:hypothetical protein SODALDRAFT_326771 [Sodiomyces alkalinus F11]ROT42612.1 hypothetical protein SODALDRAFT_326771 [Sodiomyces alkalinus F11]
MTDPATSKHLSPRCLFLPAINATRSPALECDHNMHKSNSTYFTDMDMSRINFGTLFFGKPFNPFPGPTNFNIALGGSACTWRKEIKPYQAYELWTRIISWDEKWLYVVTHFVESGVFVPEEYVMQPGRTRRRSAKKDGQKEDVDKLKTVYASCVSRYVFKNNRRTLPPEEVLRRVGLLPQDETELAAVEKIRLEALPIGRLETGWDSVHSAFEPGKTAVGWYNSAY